MGHLVRGELKGGGKDDAALAFLPLRHGLDCSWGHQGLSALQLDGEGSVFVYGEELLPWPEIGENVLDVL